jgi:hypothetical protein
MKRIISLLFLLSSAYCAVAQHRTFCNPLNLEYKYQPDEPLRREAADPTVILFKGEYFLFASKSGGYWHSGDLLNWKHIATDQLPVDDYAPTAVAIGDTLYFMASQSNTPNKIYKSADPLSGKWTVACEALGVTCWDPALFLDDDGKLYLYYGVMNNLKGVELDYRNGFALVGKPRVLVKANKNDYGWEVAGDYNELVRKTPFIEGSWVNKHGGKYYFQYATPGTEFFSYADAVYVSGSPLGDYTVQPSNPFSYKPSGFINGAGHGSTFYDKYGNLWHIATMTISVNHNFERRLGLFPAFYDSEGVLWTNTSFGDFPHKMPDRKFNSPDDYQPTGMLLSYHKPVEASSSLKEHGKEFAVNENIRQYWSAATSNKGEWLMVDLLKKCHVNAVQVNFADSGGSISALKTEEPYYQYLIEYSNDKRNWKVLIDKSKNTIDSPNDFTALPEPIAARYIRLTNGHVPYGKFAVSGLRIFGKSKGKVPQKVSNLTVERDTTDARIVTIKWQKVPGAVGYNIRYGVSLCKLYLDYQILGAETATIHSLRRNQQYFFTVDAFNESGVSRSGIVIGDEFE